MLDILLIITLLVFAFGMPHIGVINALMWFLDDKDGVEMGWSVDAFLTCLLVPIGLVVTAIELYLLFFARV